MTGSERDRIDALREEFRQLREDVQPAIEFYRAVVAIARFAKWGVGLGASIITAVGGLRVLGLW